MDTVEANKQLGFAMDLREYGLGAQILADLGVRRIRLLTNNPKKVVGLDGYGLEIVEQLPIKIAPNKHNQKYLSTKRKKMGHKIELCCKRPPVEPLPKRPRALLSWLRRIMPNMLIA